MWSTRCTAQLAINSFSWKSKANFYNPLHTIHRCLRTMTKLLFRKKIWVLQNVTKRSLHAICHRLQFLQMCVATENTAKKVLWIRQKTAYSGKHISRKSFSQNAHKSDESFSTYYSHFARISSIRSFFIIVREWCVAGLSLQFNGHCLSVLKMSWFLRWLCQKIKKPRIFNLCAFFRTHSINVLVFKKNREPYSSNDPCTCPCKVIVQNFQNSHPTIGNLFCWCHIIDTSYYTNTRMYLKIPQTAQNFFKTCTKFTQ